MNVNAGNGREGLSMDWLKSQLRAISAVEPPESLRERLEAGIPVAGGMPITGSAWPWLRTVQWTGAAAAAVITVSLVAWLGTPWGRQVRSAIDANGSPGRAYATDHNSLRPSDTNVCDINSLR